MSSPQANPADFANNLAIETPEQTTIGFEIAGIGSRFLAFLIDSLIQSAAVILAVIVLALFSVEGILRRSPTTAALFLASLILGGFLLFYGYFLLFEIFWNGQTPGKRAIGIRVIKDSGRRLSVVESIGRNLLRIVDQLPGFYAVGLLCAALNRKNKRLGDLVAGSLVVREASLKELKNVWREQTSREPQFVGAHSLTTDDLMLIETFLQRRSELNPGVRSKMAAEILHRLRDKLSVQEQGAGAEDILQAAVHERRSHGAF